MERISQNNLKTKLFYILAFTGIIANTLGFISNAVIYGMTSETIFTLACAIAIYIGSGIGFATQNISVGSHIILFVCSVIEFPVMYLVYGADRIGYLILGLVGVALFAGKKQRIIASAFIIIYDSAIIIWKFANPYAAFIKKDGDSPIAAFMDYVIAAVSITVMIIVLIRRYEEQQEQLKNLTVELQEMVNLDPLTQLYNRRYLTEYLDKKIKSDDSHFAVALLDIDNFKKINDTYGHLYGDETLKAFAGILKNTVDGIGIAARFGGEEFMIVFDSPEKDVINTRLDNARKQFDEYGMNTRHIHTTFSGGVEVFENQDMITKLFNKADEKLYSAKNAGKNQIIY